MQEPEVFEPCRSLCEYVRSDCEPELNARGYSWPAHFNCDNYPTDLKCLDVDDDVEIPLIPGLVEDSQPPTNLPVISPSSTTSTTTNITTDQVGINDKFLFS